jgi:hypothetical protein
MHFRPHNETPPLNRSFTIQGGVFPCLTLWVQFKLVKRGFFGETFKNKRGGVNAWVISRHSLHVILDSLAKGSSSFHDEKTCPLTEIFHLYGRVVAPYVLKALMENKVKYHMISEKLSETHVDKEELVSVLKDMVYEEGKIRGYFEQEEVLFLLGVKKSDLQYWIDRKWFPHNDPSSNIPFKTYEVFSEKYITTSQLSELLNIKTKRIIKLNQKGSISSVAGPSLKDGSCLLFLRSVITQFFFLNHD